MKNLLTLNTFLSIAIASALIGCGSSGGGKNPPVEPPIVTDTGKLEFSLSYDEESGVVNTKDSVSGSSLDIKNAFNKPERVLGVKGNALRTDGYSTWIQATTNFKLTSRAAIETWVALESYPSDAEVPYVQLSPSTIIGQSDSTKGFSIDINTFGEYFFNAVVNGQQYKIKANNLFPLYQWAHVVGVIDGISGSMKFYLNGQNVGELTIPVNGVITQATTPILIGKSRTDKLVGIFLVNALNAAIDETRIYSKALSATEILNNYRAGIATASTGDVATATPLTRFASDNLRPTFHAMPPANWTNEPHGLVSFNNQYHMFYQRTPNGPFKTQMNWGHLVSDDFVNWKNVHDALRPSLETGKTSGYDMKGIWSGDVVTENGTAYAFYTSVNQGGAYNPGISYATSSSPDLSVWEKKGPVIDSDKVDDFRDPAIWKEADGWHMIIGAKINGKGGLVHYTSNNLVTWAYNPTFSATPYSQMDINSEIWEMPVFEKISNTKYILLVNPIGGTVGKYDVVKPTRAVYWVGTWANGKFTPDYVQPKNLDLIRGHLSPTVVRNAAGNLTAIGIVDERRSSQAQLTAGWAHTFGIARDWYLLPDNKTLGQKPNADTQKLRIESSYQKIQNISTSSSVASGVQGNSLELNVNFSLTSVSSTYGFELLANADGSEYTRIYYDAIGKRIVLDKTHSTLSTSDEEKVQLVSAYDEAAFGKPKKFQVFIDHSVIDVFINDAAAFSFRAYPTKADSNGIKIYSNGGVATVESVEAWQMKNINN